MAHLFSFERNQFGASVLFLEIIEYTSVFLIFGLLLQHVYVESPVGRIEAPMTDTGLDIRVNRITFFVHITTVANEHLRREQPTTNDALYAPIFLGKKFVIQNTFGTAETLVIDDEREVYVLIETVGRGATFVQQHAAQTFGVRLGDQPAGRRLRRQQAFRLQRQQLFRIARRKIYK